MIKMLLFILISSLSLTPTTSHNRRSNTFSNTFNTIVGAPGLIQHNNGVYAASTISNPSIISSSSTNAHSTDSAQGNGIGLMPKMTPTTEDPAPLRPVGLDFHISASMKIHDSIARDSLLPFNPNTNKKVPLYRFDVVERNTTILYYGTETKTDPNEESSSDSRLTNEDLIRMSNSLDVMTLTYHNAMCYCRHENNLEFLTCRCERSNDPWAPPVIPKHVVRAAHTHHDKVQELLASTLKSAESNGNYKLIAVLKEAQDIAKLSIHANNIRNPNPQATEILMNDLRDAMYYALAHNGTEASDEIQEALRLVTSFHCKDHVLQQGYDDDAKRNISQKDNIVPVNNILNKLSNMFANHNDDTTELTKLVTLALKEAEKLKTSDPLLKKHLKICQTIVAVDNNSEGRRKKRLEEMQKKQNEENYKKKKREESIKKLKEEKFKRKAEENHKMQQAIELRTRSHQWTQCWTQGLCTFGAAPINDQDQPPVPAPMHLPPTVDYEHRSSNINTTETSLKCESKCSETSYGNYTVCYVECQRNMCLEKREALHDQQSALMVQIEQVKKELFQISKQER